MREEEASKLNAILTSIADGVIVQDMEGQTLIMNPAAERIITTVGDHPVQQGAVADEQAPPARLLEHLAQLGFHQQERFDIEGLRMSLSALSAPVIAADETQLGAVIVVRDITREVESDRLKDDFITSASHELRTPLTAIKGYNQLLEMTGASTMDERQKGFVKEIERNVDDLLKIIQQMLDLSQIDAGVLGVDQEPVNLTELIAMETDEWLMKLEEKELSFDLTMPDKEIWVVGDAERLGMMVDNLLSNSYNYTHSGGQVQVLVTEENGRVRVDVKDTGVGITPEDQGRLFTRFVRAIHEDSTFGETSGAGLGLYISKAIAEAHQGEMWLEQSEVHGGSVFSFALPTIDPDTYEEPAWES
jgi:PAS domain S-box-containing protein